MQIEIGKLYINKTYKYLVPVLKVYGENFILKVNSIFNLAFGIHDTLLDGTPYETQRAVYMLCDKLFQPQRFDSFLKFVKNQEYYITDYAADDAETGRQHMVVLAFPEKYGDAYDKFLEGKYSKMFCKDEIHYFFPDKDSEAREVVERTSNMGTIFINKVKNSFGTELTTSDLKVNGIEYDFPPEKQKEIFNFKH